MMAKPRSLCVSHLGELVKEVKAQHQHQPTTEAPGLDACYKRCRIRCDSRGFLAEAGEEVSRVHPQLQLECPCFYLLFFCIRMPLKILFEESTCC